MAFNTFQKKNNQSIYSIGLLVSSIFNIKTFFQSRSISKIQNPVLESSLEIQSITFRIRYTIIPIQNSPNQVHQQSILDYCRFLYVDKRSASVFFKNPKTPTKLQQIFININIGGAIAIGILNQVLGMYIRNAYSGNSREGEKEDLEQVHEQVDTYLYLRVAKFRYTYDHALVITEF